MPRRASLAPLASLVIALGVACAGTGGKRPLLAADPRQVIPGDEGAAQAEVAGVAVRASVGGWRGQPRNLEQRLTPVDVTILNGSGRPVRVGPEAFTLDTSSRRLRVLTEEEASRALADLPGTGGPRPPGNLGGPTFPGFDGPPHYGPEAPRPPGAPVPGASSWYAPHLLSGVLAPGESTSVLLFFEAPAFNLQRAALEVEVVSEDGTALGTIALPFERR